MRWSDTLIPVLPPSRPSGCVDVYGVIFYHIEHPYVNKVLRDREFWDSFNAVTGERWTIYAHDPSKVGSPVDQILAVGRAMGELGIVNYGIKPPLIAVFLRSQGAELPRCCVEPIEGRNEDETFASMLDTLQATTRVIERISEQHLGNSNDIFTQVDIEIENRKVKRMLAAFARRVPFLRELWKVVMEKEGN